VPVKIALPAKLKETSGMDQRGAILLYLIAALLIAGTLGVAIVSLTTTSTFSELQYNNSNQARHLAQSGLDYAKSALEAEDPALRNEFQSGSINGTLFNLDNGRFILTVNQDATQTNLYHITSEGRAAVGTSGEAGFLVTGEHLVSGGGGPPVSINFSDHNIQTIDFFGDTGLIQYESDPAQGYTYDWSELTLYDDQENTLVTITTNSILTYNDSSGSLGTSLYDYSGLIAPGDYLEFTFPNNPAYTTLTIHFYRFDPQDRAQVELLADNTVVYDDTINNVTNSSATITTTAPFDGFRITNDRTQPDRRFGITGIEVQ